MISSNTELQELDNIDIISISPDNTDDPFTMQEETFDDPFGIEEGVFGLEGDEAFPVKDDERDIPDADISGIVDTMSTDNKVKDVAMPSDLIHKVGKSPVPPPIVTSLKRPPRRVAKSDTLDFEAILRGETEKSRIRRRRDVPKEKLEPKRTINRRTQPILPRYSESKRKPTLTVLERKQEGLPVVESKSKARTNRYIEVDKTTLETKMKIGQKIKPKPPRARRVVYNDPRPWDEIIDYTKLFSNPSVGGYSVSDIRLFINKTGLLNLSRTIWDRNALINILMDWIVKNKLVDRIKRKQIGDFRHNVLLLYSDDESSKPGAKLNDIDQENLSNAEKILSDHYSGNIIHRLLSESFYADLDSIDELRKVIQEYDKGFADIHRYNPLARINKLVDEVEMIGGDVLYINDLGNEDVFDVLSEVQYVDSITTGLDALDESYKYDIIILDHILDYGDGREIMEKAKKLLKIDGSIIVVSFDYGYMASNYLMRNIKVAYPVLTLKRLFDYYILPNDPYMTPEELPTDFPDEPQLRTWTSPLNLNYNMQLSDETDPIIELIRIYGKSDK